MHRFTSLPTRLRTEELDAVRHELRLAKEEIARLRLEQQRTASALSTAAAVTHATVADHEAVDADWQHHVEAAVLVDSLMVACDALRTCVDQVQRQLASHRPPAELDRRSGADRRATDRADEAGSGHPHDRPGSERRRDLRSVDRQAAS